MSRKRTSDQAPTTAIKAKVQKNFTMGSLGEESGVLVPDPFQTQTKEHNYRFNIRQERKKKSDQLNIAETIWVDGKLIDRPKNLTVSYGVLLYKYEDGEHKYLLGKIPQGNSWTVFKGLPEDGETPDQTAIREFTEETSIPFPFEDFSKCKETKLFGRTSNKLLEINLVKAPENFSIATFDVDNVVKIDSGYMKGKPEIVEIQFLTKKQAVGGTPSKNKLVKVYASQVGILDHAQDFLEGQEQMKADESN